jgi:hypothetical protein
VVRAANQGRVVGVSDADLRQILRACGVLREHMRGVVTANGKSWETGYEEAHR